MIKKSQFLNLIRQGDFKELFVSELGWNRYRGHAQLPPIVVDEKEYNITAIAEIKGFQILYCEVDEIPTQSLAKKIDTKLRRQAFDYICIYRLRNTTHDLWVVPVRTNEKRDLVLVEYDNGNAEVLYQKIDGITFDFDEETNIVDLRSKVQSAFAVNSEKITKDFYAGFKKQHKAFAEFITGIDDHIEAPKNKNKQWYASVMLNRLMFCYFIQKKEFLSFDKDYLRNKLNSVRVNEGENRFFSFYRGFLRRLFSDGLNSPIHSPEFITEFGKIPYLNGGMFDEHPLERDYVYIDIPDEAFIGLFDFFDKWNWHLDTRLTASGKDINPDVLGYIFEQYINDRAQMGAYYTKEDITEYIGRNCILPFLFDKVRNTTKDSFKAFAPDGFVWKTLRESGDRYIFDAVKKGYKDFNSIPESISRGLITEEMRKEYSETPIAELPEAHVPLSELRSEWHTRTPEQWGLPNEIWRETIERLQRCDDILNKIISGEITSINDFITYNLDIRNFTADLLVKADNRFVSWFYHALQEVSILDPTCGSGAFLFAAMNILEPLYEICIDRMQEFNQQNPMLFKIELTEITDKYRSNIQYFIFKSIILRNLYGVDIMVEATEIAKLRLFLKMVAVVEVDRRAPNLGLDPLPDIDFNIRCGNTLVGYANEKDLTRDLTIPNGDLDAFAANEEFKTTIEEEMRNVARAYDIFKDIQLRHSEDMSAFKQAKSDLRVRLSELNDKLNRRLHVASAPEMNYNEWLTSHQPFNWLADFYQIIEGNSGFDVIIGNPPYVEYSSVRHTYKVSDYRALSSGNLYSYVIERCYHIINTYRYIGMIIPISAFCTARMNSFMQVALDNSVSIWISNYAERPGKLFEGAERNLSIMLCKTGFDGGDNIYTTNYIKWKAETRSQLFKNIVYSNTTHLCDSNGFPKCNNQAEIHCFTILKAMKYTVGDFISPGKNHNILYYKNSGGRYWKFIATFKPLFYLNNELGTSSRETHLYMKNCDDVTIFAAILNSSLYFWSYVMNSDTRTNNPSDLKDFKINYEKISERNRNSLKLLGSELMLQLQENATMVEAKYRTGDVRFAQYAPGLSKQVIDKIDIVLANHYGFTDEELDFIINYDIKYRMGEELNNSNE